MLQRWYTATPTTAGSGRDRKRERGYAVLRWITKMFSPLADCSDTFSIITAMIFPFFYHFVDFVAAHKHLSAFILLHLTTVVFCLLLCQAMAAGMWWNLILEPLGYYFNSGTNNTKRWHACFIVWHTTLRCFVSVSTCPLFCLQLTPWCNHDASIQRIYSIGAQHDQECHLKLFLYDLYFTVVLLLHIGRNYLGLRGLLDQK